jgi:hypothetical protein
MGTLFVALILAAYVLPVPLLLIRLGAILASKPRR